MQRVTTTQLIDLKLSRPLAFDLFARDITAFSRLRARHCVEAVLQAM
jgi:hypothetical protein